jgi:hypothetical protein
MMDEDREIMRAVERYAATVTVPVMHEHAEEQVDQIGTGTLFDHDDRLLLVTAGHIFDQIKPENLVIPSRDTTALAGIGPYNLYRPDDRDIDLAVVELRHPPSIERARASWTVLDLDRTTTASDQGWFVLSGYPSVRSRRAGGLLGSTLLSLHTWRLPEVPAGAKPPIHPDLDLFFRFEGEAEGLDGSTAEVPHLGGCSGGPVWEYREPAGITFWTVEQCLSLVGVQSAFKPSSNYFRAKSRIYVREMIERLVREHPST